MQPDINGEVFNPFPENKKARTKRAFAGELKEN